jgi:hypothetical protein
MIRAVNEWIIRKRDGRTVPFESKLIFRAICNAFRAELNLASGQPLDADIEREVGRLRRTWFRRRLLTRRRIAEWVWSTSRTWWKCS